MRASLFWFSLIYTLHVHGESQPPAPSPTFAVQHYEVVGNTSLRQEVIDRTFTNAVGPAVTLEQIKAALGELQLAYRERGLVTVSVSLPPQKITNGTVQVKVTEGVLRDVVVKGNRFFSGNNVVRTVPSLKTNELINGHILQRELDIANLNRDRQIYPTIGPGPEPGTSAITLKVKDRLPLHGRFDVDNYATPGTPDLRMNFAAQYNNLWQQEHQVGVSYGFSPGDFKSEGLVPNYIFNQPLISFYGAYYRIPFNFAGSIQDQISKSADFGYNEATHQFRLPPAGPRPDLTIYASASSSDTGVKLGQANLVTQTPLISIVSQDSGQDLSVNEQLGARLSTPLNEGEKVHWGLSGGVDFKRFVLSSFNTNNFIITTVITNAQGSQTIQSTTAAPQPARRNSIEYLPLNLGLDFSEKDKRGTTSANLNANFSFVGESAKFAALSYSSKADAVYAKFNLSVTREQILPKEWSLLLRGSGQMASGPLISNEQFPLGGISSVRGYYEGDEYGDAGFFGSAEVKTPQFATHVASIDRFVPTWLRASAFLDYGQRILLEAPPGTRSGLSLLGTGVGLSANINNHFDARLTVAWPLLDSGNTQAGTPRAYFTLGGQF